MHARHRSPGNGYRSGTMGMGFGHSRIMQEASGRGRGFYNSEYRSFNNRGFGRGQSQGQGQPRNFQPALQSPLRKGDILMEAGKLAAEYLVSKGLLPANALSGRWQNGSFKKQIGNYQDFRLEEDLSQDRQISGSGHIASGASDSGSSKRRLPNDFDLSAHAKGRRRAEYERGFSLESGREYERSGSWSEKSRVSPDMEGKLDNVSRQYEDKQESKVASDWPKNSPPIESTADTVEETSGTHLEAEKQINVDEMVSRGSSSGAGKHDTDGDQVKGSDDSQVLDMGNEEMQNKDYNEETEKQIVQDTEGDLSGDNGSDLVMLSKFANMPTKTRTSLASKATKVYQVPSNDENASNLESLEGSEVLVQDITSDVSTAAALTGINHGSKPSESETTELAVQSSDDGRDLEPSFGTGQLHRAVQESNEVSGIEKSVSVKERGEKRSIEDSDLGEATKRPREWLPALSKTEELCLSNVSEVTMTPQESVSSDQQVIGSTQDSIHDSRQYPKSESQQSVKHETEKKVFPGSFKICDLNFMEASDANDSNRNDAAHTCSSIMMPNKGPEVDIDLSMSNPSSSIEYPRQASAGKDIEMIDLENDSIPEDKTFDGLQQKEEATFSGSEGFPSHIHVQNGSDITDVPVSYDGLMISEFLSAFPNSEDINPLPNDMGLHHGEGALGDDDAIYMSLGEIPLTFMPSWEQPPSQEYDKPF